LVFLGACLRQREIESRAKGKRSTMGKRAIERQSSPWYELSKSKCKKHQAGPEYSAPFAGEAVGPVSSEPPYPSPSRRIFYT
jgi:hypothetical protein